VRQSWADESLDESDHTLGMVDRSSADSIGTVVAGYYRDLCRSCITDLVYLLIHSLPEEFAGGAAMVLDLRRRLIQSVRYRVDSRAESRWDSQRNIRYRCYTASTVDCVVLDLCDTYGRGWISCCSVSERYFESGKVTMRCRSTQFSRIL
jgi:hypothetical protein